MSSTSRPAQKRQMKKKSPSKNSEENQEGPQEIPELTGITAQVLKDLMSQMNDIRSELKGIKEVRASRNDAPAIPIPEREEASTSQPDQLNEGFKSVAAEIKKLTDNNRQEGMVNVRQQIPKFNGELKNFLTWKTLFTRIVASLTKSPAIKMEYLTEALSTKSDKEQYAPITLIEYLDISDEQYEVAMNILEKRYNNPVKMATEQMDEMFNLKRKTSDVDGHLRLTIDTYQRVMANVRKVVMDANADLK